MGITELIFGEPTKVGIGTSAVGLVELDCSVSEKHLADSDITDHPVEILEGATGTVADHVRELPETIEINGLVTNTPILWLATLSSESPVTPGIPTTQRVDAAYEKLRELKARAALIDVVTSLRTYNNMIIKSILITRERDTGNVLDCALTLREIKTVTSLALEGPIPDDVANKAAAEAARKQKDAASASQSAGASSVLNDILSGGASALGF